MPESIRSRIISVDALAGPMVHTILAWHRAVVEGD
jgi:hypothetical protein